MNQLQWLKSKLIEEERYEEAAKINKCIEDEYNKLKNRKHESKWCATAPIKPPASTVSMMKN